MIQARLVELLNAVHRQQVSVGDHAGDHAVVADAADDVVEFRVQDGLAAADGDNGGAEARQVVNAIEHGSERHGLAGRVELVAIGAGQVAAAHGDDVRHDDVVGIQHSMGDHAQLPQAAVGGDPFHPKALFSL